MKLMIEKGNCMSCKICAGVMIIWFYAIPTLCYSALINCKIGNINYGKWVDEEVSVPNAAGDSCIMGFYKYVYTDLLKVDYQTCQDRVDSNPSQFPPGTKVCGLEKNPCGETLDYFPTGYNCCVQIKRMIWECNTDQNNVSEKKSNFGAHELCAK